MARAWSSEGGAREGGGRATEALWLSAESHRLPRPAFRGLGPGDRSRGAWPCSLPRSQTTGWTGPGLTLRRSETRAPSTCSSLVSCSQISYVSKTRRQHAKDTRSPCRPGPESVLPLSPQVRQGAPGGTGHGHSPGARPALGPLSPPPSSCRTEARVALVAQRGPRARPPQPALGPRLSVSSPAPSATARIAYRASPCLTPPRARFW